MPSLPGHRAILAAALLASTVLPAGRRALAGCIPAYGNLASVPGLSAPTSVTVADVNGDGRPDLLAVTGGRLVVSLNDGTGHFLPPVSIANGSGRFVVADFDGDGHADVAFANVTSHAAEIYTGKGDGTFRAAMAFPTIDGYPWDVAAGDFDGDGATDLAILLGGAVEIHLQRNRALAAEGVRSATGTFGDRLWAMDLDVDGRTDLLVDHTQFGGSDLYSCLSLGNGSFVPWLSGIHAGGYHLGYRFDSGDLTAAGHRDVVVVNSGNGLPASLQVFRGDPGGFTEGSVLSLERTAASDVAVVDFEGDGRKEVAVLLFTLNEPGGVLVIYRALDASRLSFASRQPLPMHGFFAFADFDGDGVLDLLLWSPDDVTSPYVLRGTCPAGPPHLPVTGNPTPVFRRPAR